MTTFEQWTDKIETACAEPDLAASNRAITHLHYRLSEELASALGRSAGPNFHTWAVWGSQKAGVTIRQEDLDSAIQNATFVAGIIGSIIGTVVGTLFGRRLRWSGSVSATTGAALGSLLGAQSGKQIAIWSRQKAAELIAQGNQAVLRDIGVQSARFLKLLQSGAGSEERETFFSGLRLGAAEKHGQDKLAKAFRAYLVAFDSPDIETKREAMIKGNSEIVHHEHIRLEPYIRGAMPFIIQRCATERLMSFEIGDRMLSVSKDLPGVPASIAAANWTDISQRMRYIFALFREFHDDPALFSAPAS